MGRLVVMAMSKPTIAEIQSRHDYVSLSIVKHNQLAAIAAHNDRGILLDRLEAAEKLLKAGGWTFIEE